MRLLAAPRTWLLITLSLVCVVIWTRNILLFTSSPGPSRSQAAATLAPGLDERLPDRQDFRSIQRDPFREKKSELALVPAPSPNSRVPVPPGNGAENLPFEFVGRIAGGSGGKALVILRDRKSGTDQIMSIADSLAGYVLKSIGQDTLRFEGNAGQAFVVAK